MQSDPERNTPEAEKEFASKGKLHRFDGSEEKAKKSPGNARRSDGDSFWTQTVPKEQGKGRACDNGQEMS
jgi:hypothetical protein